MVIIMILLFPILLSIHLCLDMHVSSKFIFFLLFCFYPLIWDLLMIYKYLSTVSCIIVRGCQKSIKNHMKTLLPFRNISELIFP